LETYIYEDDELGSRLARALAQAADRGVKVRVMADGFGSAWWPGRLERIFGKRVELRVFHPIPGFTWLRRHWTFHPGRLTSRLKKLFRLLSRINRRNHRKTCVIDSAIAYVGSMNVSSWHVPSLKGRDAWRDSGIRIQGEIVRSIRDAFRWAWTEAREAGRRQPAFRDPSGRRISRLVRLNHAYSLRRANYLELLGRISSAHSRVWLTNAYFVPVPSLVRALKLAVANGADVRLIIPRKSDLRVMLWVAKVFYGGLIRGGVRVFEYLPSVLHAKVAIVDDWAILGSSNLNHRSLFHDLEIDVLVLSAEGRTSLERQFVRDVMTSEEITLSTADYPGWIARIVGRVGYWARYFL